MLYEALFDSSVALCQETWTSDVLAGIPTCKGVLLFVDSDLQPIQLMQTVNLRRTAQSRLLRITDYRNTRKADVSTLAHAVYYRCCYNDFQSALTLLTCSRSFKQKKNVWIQLPTPAFAIIDLAKNVPYFSVSSNPVHTHACKIFGPFPSRKEAHEFCDIQNTAFSLCRNPSLLTTDNRSCCPYLQMNMCIGPCLDRNKYTAYYTGVQQAVRAANRDIEPLLQVKQEQMRQAAASRQYETAEQLKKSIELLERLEQTRFAWVSDLDQLCLLHVDQGPKIASENGKSKESGYMCWKITSRAIIELGNFPLNTLENIEAFCRIDWNGPALNRHAYCAADHFSVLGLLLFRNRPPGLWISASQRLIDPKELWQKLQVIKKGAKD